MFPQLSTSARAATFFLLAFGMCCLVAVLSPSPMAAGVLAMFTPSLAVLLMKLVVTREGWHRAGWSSLGLHRLGLRFWPVAATLPVLVIVASESLVRLTGLTVWPLFDAAAVLVQVVDLPFSLAFALAVALAEEIGWRGYLSPLLAADGRPAPYLRTGLLHGLWHLPLVFLATDTYLVDGNRWLVVPCFLAVLTCAGVVYGRLRELSGSVYPAMVLHGVFNTALLLAAGNVATTSPDTVALLGREGGVLTLAVLVVTTFWVAWRYPSTAGAPERGPTQPVGTPR